MRKDYRDAIISGIVGAILGTIIISLIQGKVAWTFLFTYLIFFTALKLYSTKRREEKKDQEGVR